MQLTAGQEVTITTDYSYKGDEKMFAMTYKFLARDVKPGGQILIGDGSIVLQCISADMNVRGS